MRSFRLRSTSIDTEHCAFDKSNSVLQLLRRLAPLTLKQVEFCDQPCIARFLNAKGNHVKKAAKQLAATLSWRANFDVDYLTADEFSAELAAGTAFVAGSDDEGRPILILRMKPEHLTSQAQKQFLRFFVFTMEVAIASLPATIQQCILILDAGSLKKGSPGLSMIVHLLKVLGDHYPERIARTFVVDAPSTFYYLWKGIGAFLDLGMREKLRFVFSRNYSATSGSSNLMSRAARSYSSRSLWTEQSDTDQEDDKFDYLHASTRTNRSTQIVSRDSSCNSSFRHTSGAALVSDKTQARSLSFASPATRNWTNEAGTMEFRSFRADTGAVLRGRDGTKSVLQDGSRRWADFSSAFGSKREEPALDYAQKERSIDLFRPYLNFFRSPYNEVAYRARMKPPLGGLISIISPELKRQPSFSYEGNGMETMLKAARIW